MSGREQLAVAIGNQYGVGALSKEEARKTYHNLIVTLNRQEFLSVKKALMNCAAELPKEKIGDVMSLIDEIAD